MSIQKYSRRLIRLFIKSTSSFHLLFTYRKTTTIKVLYVFLFVLYHATIGVSQQITLVTPLQESINESSGLLFLHETLITHNDSENSPLLFEIDSLTGNVVRTVEITNATNIDWEDICTDNTYIYIADIGNNDGIRTDLKIYRVLILDYFNSQNNSITADIINFSYSDQTDFSDSQFSTNYDAEALIVYNDYLYIFTKNWGNNWTNVYELPIEPGTYEIDKIDSINTQGLITGATINPSGNTIMLSGYTAAAPFFVEINDFNPNEFSSGIINRTDLELPLGYSYQIEGISQLSQNQYYITSEDSFAGISGLFRLDLYISASIEEVENSPCTIFPNPTSDVIHVKCPDISTIEIYDSRGTFVKTSTNQNFSTADLSSGLYNLIIKRMDGVSISTHKILVFN